MTLPRPQRPLAFSLIEIMVAVGLLSVLIIGLLAMFYQTQRAFRLGVGQVDVMESGRLVMENLGRELQETVAAEETNLVNIVFRRNDDLPPFLQPLPSARNEFRTNMLFDLFFMRKENDRWIGTAYRMNGGPAGDLYRLQYTGGNHDLRNLQSLFGAKLADPLPTALTDEPPFSRLVDGVVHFQITPCDRNGYPIVTPAPNARVAPGTPFYQFENDNLPAFLDLELGILEGPTYATYRARPTPQLKADYLEQQAGKVHLFRKRIPIRAAQ